MERAEEIAIRERARQAGEEARRALDDSFASLDHRAARWALFPVYAGNRAELEVLLAHGLEPDRNLPCQPPTGGMGPAIKKRSAPRSGMTTVM